MDTITAKPHNILDIEIIYFIFPQSSLRLITMNMLMTRYLRDLYLQQLALLSFLPKNRFEIDAENYVGLLIV